MQTVSDFLTEAVQITKQIGSKTSQYPSNEGVFGMLSVINEEFWKSQG